MVVIKRKKNIRQRGENTHGWGSQSRHRGAGNRGGVGMAGSGKRAAHKKIYILKTYGHEYYGRHGFTSLKKKTNVKEKAINIRDIELRLDKLGKKEGTHFIVNLKELGYTKVLSTGIVKNKLKIICDSFSKIAKEKIEKAGGEIVS